MESDLEGVPLLPSPLNPIPNPSPNPNRGHGLLRAAKSTAFKREERRNRRERKRQERLVLELAQWDPLGGARPPSSRPSPAPSDTPWPCDPAPEADPAPADWGCWWGRPAEPSPAPANVPPPPPPCAWAAAQAAAVSASRAFFSGVGEEEEEEEGSNAARFFDELFEKGGELKGFYQEKWEKGEFLCLVCEGIGARVGKRFAGCAALVQHAGSIARSKRTQAHRALGDAIRRLLGWDVGRPTVSPVDSNNGGTSGSNEFFDLPEGTEMEE